MNPIRRRTAPIAITAAALLVFGGAAQATAIADEQDTLDATVAAFSDRLAAAGWESTGEPAFGDDSEDADANPLDEAFEACLGEDTVVIFEALQADDAQEGPRAQSDEFVFAPDADAAAEFDVEESAGLNIVSLVGDDDIAAAGAVVDRLGEDEVAECFSEAIQEELEAEFAGEAADADEHVLSLLMDAMQFEATSEADLGVGDNSARLGFAVNFGTLIDLTLEATFDLVLTDNRVIMLMYTSEGVPAGEAPPSGFDRVAELEHIVTDLSA